jgi:hypothetical protein
MARLYSPAISAGLDSTRPYLSLTPEGEMRIGSTHLRIPIQDGQRRFSEPGWLGYMYFW